MTNIRNIDLERVTNNAAFHNSPYNYIPRSTVDSHTVLKIVGTITSHAAMISAVLFYFGWERTRAIFAYFGIDATLIGYNSTDYILRSVSVAFPALIGAACTALLLLGIHHIVLLPMLRRLIRSRASSVVRRFISASKIVAIALVALAAMGVFFPEQVGIPLGMMLPLSLIIAIISLGYIGHLQSCYPALLGTRQSSPQSLSFQLKRSIFITLGLLATLWTVSLYADQLGTQEAKTSTARLSAEPAVILYSTDRMAIAGHGVKVKVIDETDTKYHYQYSGIRLLARSNDKFILVPVGWERGQDSIFLIRDDSSIRIDLTVGARERTS